MDQAWTQPAGYGAGGHGDQGRLPGGASGRGRSAEAQQRAGGQGGCRGESEPEGQEGCGRAVTGVVGRRNGGGGVSCRGHLGKVRAHKPLAAPDSIQSGRQSLVSIVARFCSNLNRIASVAQACGSADWPHGSLNLRITRCVVAGIAAESLPGGVRRFPTRGTALSPFFTAYLEPARANK